MLLSLFPHLCFKVAPCSSCSESHILCLKVGPCFSYSESHRLSFSYTSGDFSLQNLACIFLRWASSNALGFREQESWMHTHQFSFVELSFIYSSSASVSWQSLLLMLTSIDGHSHSSLIILFNVRLSPFCLLHTIPNHYSIPSLVLYPWLTLMYCVKVEKV